jgi:hypothetical protein
MKTILASIGRRTAFAAILAGTLASQAFAQDNASQQQETDMRVRIEFNGVSMTAVLYDNPSARDFASMLPLDLELDNYGNNEKIAYLPRKLTEEGSGPITGEAPGDLAYYAPWGNIIFYYADWSYTNGLIRLGRFEGGIEPLLVPGKFDVHIELIQ